MQLHRELANDGLVLITLDVEPDDWDARDKVLAVLRGKQLPGPNYILRDDEDTARRWLIRHDALSTPAIAVYDRDGFAVPIPAFPGKKGVAKWEAEEQWVRELVKAK